MIKVLVVTDDMTGNNDTGALLNQAGLDTVTAISDHMQEEWFMERDALCLNTDSRAMSAELAKAKVKAAVESYWKPDMLCCKRIDSTLRGNIGSEIDGMLEALPAGTKAVVVPAFPRADRICVGGHILVHGVPLTKSDAGTDAKTPVYSSRVSDIIALQSGRSVECVALQEIEGEEEELAYIIRKSAADILVMDAVREEDIERIADACCRAGVQIACVDPGSFSVWMAKKLFLTDKKTYDKNLLVIGSLSSVSRRQTAYFVEKTNSLLYKVSVKEMMKNYETVKQEVLTFFEQSMDDYENICLLTEDKPLSEGGESVIHEAEEIAKRFADIGVALLDQNRAQIACVYLSGGDIAKAFLEDMMIEGIDILDEVIPLAVYGKTIDRKHKSIQILTKGGMIGNESAIADMIQYAKRVR